MNSGLLQQRIRFQRMSRASDEFGEPLEAWASVGDYAARRKPISSRSRNELTVADRDPEMQRMVFQRGSRPFCTIYRDGDRLVELKPSDFPETVWAITGWNELEGSKGMYVEVNCGRSESVSVP